MKLATSTFAGFFLLGLLNSQVLAGSLTVGTNSGPDFSFTFPFSNTGNGGFASEYQEVYNANQFSGPITISELTFFGSALQTGALQDGTYEIELSTTTQAVNALNTNYLTNLTSAPTVFGTYVLSGQSISAGAPLNFTASTPFEYTPESGSNLLMTVIVTGANPETGGAGFEEDATSGTVLSIQDDFQLGSNTFPNTGDFGLVTEFNANPVPEPSSFALFGAAITGLAGMFWLRRRSATRLGLFAQDGGTVNVGGTNTANGIII